jgi:oxygen-dependent protoporphyrinogen oxidase
MEWAQPTRRDAADESAFDFAARRIGREAAEVLVDAMVTGIYAGDSRNLSLTSAFPRMRDMEQRYGGLFKAMRAQRRERRKQGNGKRGNPMGPGGTLTSFAEGLETIVHALAAALGESLQLSSGVVGLKPPEERRSDWTVQLASGAEVQTERVVLANPAWKAEPILRSLDAALADVVGRIPSAPVAVVCLGFRSNDVAHLQPGFGFLVPGREKLPILGALFDTWVFPNRSQDGHVLMRAMIGGAREPEALEETDAQLTDRALSTLSRLLSLRATPELVFVVRHLHGIPQYPVGHPTTLARIDAAVARHRGLFLTGNSYRGIAMNACIKEAEALAARLAAELLPSNGIST